MFLENFQLVHVCAYVFSAISLPLPSKMWHGAIFDSEWLQCFSQVMDEVINVDD